MSTSSKSGSLVLLVLLPAFYGNSAAQVSAVKELSEANTGSSGGEGVEIVFDAAEWLLNGLIAGHSQIMTRRHDEPWLLSLDVNLHGGYYARENATTLSPSIRGNWGLFSSHFRYNDFRDFTGAFPTYDWQIVQLNFVAQPEVNLRMGSGFMREVENDRSHYEHFLGLDLHFMQRRLNPALEVRWAQDFAKNRTARFELNTRVSYFFARYGSVRVGLMAGFLYQKYYEQVNFYFAQTGLTFNIY